MALEARLKIAGQLEGPPAVGGAQLEDIGRGVRSEGAENLGVPALAPVVFGLVLDKIQIFLEEAT